jgi:uncharacterized protein (DUF2237 family)
MTESGTEDMLSQEITEGMANSPVTGYGYNQLCWAKWPEDFARSMIGDGLIHEVLYMSKQNGVFCT